MKTAIKTFPWKRAALWTCAAVGTAGAVVAIKLYGWEAVGKTALQGAYLVIFGLTCKWVASQKLNFGNPPNEPPATTPKTKQFQDFKK